MPKISDHDRQLITALLDHHRIDRDDPDLALLELVQVIAAIPWGEGRTIAEILGAKKVGTCTGKHLVLQACLDELGIEYRPVVCTFHWKEQEIKFPNELQEILEEHSWPHGHNFVQVKAPRISESKARSEVGWIDVDIAWDPALKPYGFWTFPEDWDGEHSFHSVKILERWDGVAIAEKKDELIHTLSPEQQHARAHFLRMFIEWVASLRSS